MRCSTSCGPQASPWRPQRGQALVEAAILIPLGLLLLLAVGYLGRGLIESQNMLMAARYAAREAALDAMSSPAYKFSGAGVLRETTTSGNRGQSAADAARTQVSVSPPDWTRVLDVPTTQLKPVPLGPYGVAYLAQSHQTVANHSVTFALGFVLYGAKVNERLGFLEPVRQQLVGAARYYGQPGPTLMAPLVVSGTAFMPGEVPVHHPVVGLLETNSWIGAILKQPSS